MMTKRNLAVLIVDDDQPLREMLSVNFESKGCKVQSAHNGSTALELTEHHDFDVILTDVRMPNGSGFDLLRAVKEANYDAPAVLFMSGHLDFSLQEAFDKGADAVFNKPVDLKVLDNAVARVATDKNRLWMTKDGQNVDFKIDLPGWTLKEAMDSKVVSLGRGGMFVALEKDFPRTDSIVEFSFRKQTSSKDVQEGSGIVRWVRTEKREKSPTGCGIEFLTLSDSFRAQVIDYATESKCKPYIPKN